ncbi:MAG TPA: hypothetical protein VG838_17495 [Opitutaceae bacterium]|nr:hypothetical protein [Opitutaceae bacterium]
MNHLSHLLPAWDDSPPAACRRLYSDRMLGELLSLHEEMILQLRLERLEAGETSTDFLTGLIEQHERTAAMLRLRLAAHEGAPEISLAPEHAEMFADQEAGLPA